MAAGARKDGKLARPSTKTRVRGPGGKFLKPTNKTGKSEVTTHRTRKIYDIPDDSPALQSPTPQENVPIDSALYEPLGDTGVQETGPWSPRRTPLRSLSPPPAATPGGDAGAAAPPEDETIALVSRLPLLTVPT
jgi:hypothetical protein